MIYEVSHAATAGSHHLSRIWFQRFGPRGTYESLRGRQETREEGGVSECGDLGIGFDRGFTEDGKARRRENTCQRLEI